MNKTILDQFVNANMTYSERDDRMVCKPRTHDCAYCDTKVTNQVITCKWYPANSQFPEHFRHVCKCNKKLFDGSRARIGRWCSEVYYAEHTIKAVLKKIAK